jgi:hypothetical protein
MPAGAMQQHEIRAGSGAQHPGPHPGHVDVAKFVIDRRELGPDADVFGQFVHEASANIARASSTVHSPALCLRATPNAESRREFSIVKNSTGASTASL